MKKIIVSMALLVCSGLSAKELNLENWLQEELGSHQLLLAEIDKNATNNELLLSTLRIRLRATVSAEVPLVAKGKIRPEIELYFKR